MDLDTLQTAAIGGLIAHAIWTRRAIVALRQHTRDLADTIAGLGKQAVAMLGQNDRIMGAINGIGAEIKRIANR